MSVTSIIGVVALTFVAPATWPATTYQSPGGVAFAYDDTSPQLQSAEPLDPTQIYVCDERSNLTQAKTGTFALVLAGRVGFVAPKVTRTASGEVTNGAYTISRVPQARHTTGSTTSGRSQFLFRVDADEAVLDAAAYADQAGLWVNNKAKVLVTNGPVGVLGRSGELTSYINLYRTKGGYVHGAPGTTPR